MAISRNTVRAYRQVQHVLPRRTTGVSSRGISSGMADGKGRPPAASRGISGLNVSATSTTMPQRMAPWLRPAAETKPKPLRLGGVPEHTNGPFHWALAPGGAYEKAGLKATWTAFPKGTGDMVEAVWEDEVDVACVLLEGAVAAIANGAPLRIIGTYQRTPMTWGIHVKAESPFKSVEELRGKVFGVSKMGSGSHLMACVMAHQMGWSMEDLKTKAVGSLDLARHEMKDDTIDAWLWEKFTADYLVEQGEIRRLATVHTPWPGSVLVAHAKTCKERGEELKKFLAITQPVCESYKANVLGKTTEYVSEKHNLSADKAEAWLSSVDWACHADVPQRAIWNATALLKVTGQIPAVL
jgi:ABC-type nitrate/sulfonate/bicarbonate transport system substrate-binding protein